MELKPLSQLDCELIRQWRNDCMPMLRTPYMLTEEMQADFYREVVCNRKSNARYWGAWHTTKMLQVANNDPNMGIFIGMVGLENIEWENRLAEISIIISPEYHHNGYGVQALDLLFDVGFNKMNLENIYAECYFCNPARGFWHKMAEKYNENIVFLPSRKFWNGKYHDSLYINFNREKFNENRVSESA